MCYHLCDFPSPVIHFNMFPTLGDYKSAYGTHLVLHSGTLRWLCHAHKEIWQGSLLPVWPAWYWQREINLGSNAGQYIQALFSSSEEENSLYTFHCFKIKEEPFYTGFRAYKIKRQMHTHIQMQTKSSLIGLGQLLWGWFIGHGGHVFW